MPIMHAGHVLNEDGVWVPYGEYVQGVLDRNARLAKTTPAPTMPDRPKWAERWNFLPYRGFDYKRYPRTFMTLLLFYTLPEWNKEGKMVPGPYTDLYENSKAKKEREESGKNP